MAEERLQRRLAAIRIVKLMGDGMLVEFGSISEIRYAHRERVHAADPIHGGGRLCRTSRQ
jgi:hypothetical protein